ncbi:MAG: protein kinase [Planctomycetota bacterium]
MRDSAPEPELNLVEEIADAYLAQLQRGESPDRRRLIDQHRNIATELERRLRAIDLLHDVAASSTQNRRLEVTCPHCRTRCVLPIESREFVCSSCNESIRIEFSDSTIDELPQSIGKFQILSMLGRGSFGTVYLGLDSELDRQVAIKVPRVGIFLSSNDERRFLREARSSALLRHPGIVGILEIGDESGVPYIVSEFIEGRTLADVIRNGELQDFSQIAELVAQVADAISAAHEKGIVHRDIKPGNILVDRQDVPHVSDFGLAWVDGDDVSMTADGQVLGTPAYMSPEQAAGTTSRVGPHSDVYALGVLLYELLTRERPFKGAKTAVVERVLHDEPRAPRLIDTRVPRELETICLKAMEKEPVRRYASAEELALDLRRFLRGEPIRAVRPGTFYRVGKWSRRKPALAAMSALVAVLALAFLVGSIVATLRIRDGERGLALAEVEIARRLADTAVEAGARRLEEGDLFAALPHLAESLRLYGSVPNSADQVLDARRRLNAVIRRSPTLIDTIFFDNLVELATFSPDGKSILAADHEGVARVVHLETRKTAEVKHGQGVTCGTFSRDGTLVATGSLNGLVLIWQVSDGRVLGRHQHRGDVRSIEFSRDGRLVATSSDDGTARVWSVESSDEVARFRHSKGARSAGFDATGQLLITSGLDGRAAIWSVEDGTLDRDLKVFGPTYAAGFSPNPSRLLTRGNRSIQVWDAERAKRIPPRMYHSDRVVWHEFSPNGDLIVTASYDKTARVWSAETRDAVSPPLDHAMRLTRARFSPCGLLVVTASVDGTARVWEARTGRPVTPPLRHVGIVNDAAFSPDGRRIVTAGFDRNVKVWDLRSLENAYSKVRHANRLNRRENTILQTIVAPDGESFATLGADRTLRTWNAKTRELLTTIEFEEALENAAFSSDGTVLAVSETTKITLLRDALADPRTISRIPFEGKAVSVSFSSDARVVLIAAKHSCAIVRKDGAGYSPTAEKIRLRAPCRGATLSPDGTQFVPFGSGVGATVYSTESGQRLFLLNHGREVNRVEYSRDGKYVATASSDYRAKIWLAKSGKLSADIEHDFFVHDVSFDPRGTRLVTASRDGTARVWTVPAGHPAAPRALRHGAAVLGARFSDDGSLIVTWDDSGSLRIWNAATARIVGPAAHGGRIREAGFVLSGSKVLTYDGGPFASLWDISPTTAPQRELEAASRALSGVRIGEKSLVRDRAPDVHDAWRDWAPLRPKVQEQAAQSWHERFAEYARVHRQLEARAWHLSRLIELQPSDWRLYNERIKTYRAMKRLDLAAPDVARLLKARALDFEAKLKEENGSR